jgi:hypothetical protein
MKINQPPPTALPADRRLGYRFGSIYPALGPDIRSDFAIDAGAVAVASEGGRICVDSRSAQACGACLPLEM